MQIYYLTAGFPMNDTVQKLEAAAQKEGFCFINLACHTNYSRVELNAKFDLIKKFVNSTIVAPDDIIVFSDAYDVVVFDSSRSIVDKFKSFNADIVFNGEKGFYPSLETLRNIGSLDRSCIKSFFEEKYCGRYPHINSGCFIGYVDAVRDMVDFSLNENIETGVEDDQALAQYYAYQKSIDKKFSILVDDKANIFATTPASEQDYTFDGFTFRNIYTNTLPGIAHSAGPKIPLPSLHAIRFMRDYANLGFRLNAIRCGDYYLKYRSDINEIEFQKDPYYVCPVISDRNGTKCTIITINSEYLTFEQYKNKTGTSAVMDAWETIYIGADNSFSVFHSSSEEPKPISHYFRQDVGHCSLVPMPLEGMFYMSETLLERIAFFRWK